MGDPALVYLQASLTDDLGAGRMPTEGRYGEVEAAAQSFPRYTATETAADRVLHLCALPVATVAVGWLLLMTLPTAWLGQAVAEIIYAFALIGMLLASTAYNLSRSVRRKELLRRIDHAMIFVMIAGTYTPFALVGLRYDDGPLLCALIWSLASIGIVVKLAYPRRFERFMFAVYLMMGWAFLGVGRGLATHLSAAVIIPLIVGGVAYSMGAFLHAYGRPQFHNVAWHALVLLGVGLHWLAVAHLSGAVG